MYYTTHVYNLKQVVGINNINNNKRTLLLINGNWVHFNLNWNLLCSIIMNVNVNDNLVSR